MTNIRYAFQPTFQLYFSQRYKYIQLNVTNIFCSHFSQRYKYISSNVTKIFNSTLQIHFVQISANVPHSADTTQESDDVELKVGKSVEGLPLVWEEGESFFIGERSDGGPRYSRLWDCWEGFWRALKFKNII